MTIEIIEGQSFLCLHCTETYNYNGETCTVCNGPIRIKPAPSKIVVSI